MALFLPGTSCALSGRRIDRAEDAVLFPPFVANRADPLYVVSDGVVLKEEFERWPLGRAALDRVADLRRRTGSPHVCYLCGAVIEHPDDHWSFGPLTGDPSHPLRRFDGRQAHRACIRGHPDIATVRAEIVRMRERGEWVGPAAVDFPP